MKTVCGLSDQGAPAALPDDGVAVYVGMFPAGTSVSSLATSCPGAIDPAQIASGPMRGLSDTVFGAIAVAGPDASDTDRAIATKYVQNLNGVDVTPIVTPASAAGPGYVMATGQGGDVSWRLEAGVTSFDPQDGTPTVGAAMVTTDPSGEGSRTLEPPPSGTVNDDYVDLGAAGVVQFGTATAHVSGIDVVDSSGNAQPATILPWPAGLGSLPGVAGAPGGWLWYASAAERETVRPVVTSEPTAVPTPTPADIASGERLQTRIDPNGDRVVYGRDLGHDWEIRRIENSFELFIDGSTTPVASAFSTSSWGSTLVDVDGGTFVIGIEDPNTQSFDVTTDPTDQTPSTTIAGRWTPMRDGVGQLGRLWVLALPGSGTGLESMNHELPDFVSWPSQPFHDGSVIAGGGDGTVSWALRWHNDNCFMLLTLGTDPGDTGASQCLPAEATGPRPAMSGVFGSTRATVAMVVSNRPPTTVQAPGSPKGNLQCQDIIFQSNFAGTTICIFSVEVGQTITISLDQNGDPLGGPYTVSANPGSIGISPPGVEMQASPEPLP
jgi:hypothetical protein